jgi:hypothetical protein
MSDSGYSQLTPEQKAEVNAISTAVWNVPPPYDVLLAERVKQLKEIDESAERIALALDDARTTEAKMKLKDLRYDLMVMIADAERQYSEF